MNICVFCGAATGNNPVYAETAKTLGQLLAGQRHTLIYGGGCIGLMGILADSVLEHGGNVIGVIPDFLVRKEIAHNGLTKLEIVQTMHDRKLRMESLSDAFLALPGGLGTLEELAEISTWHQLGLVSKPISILNTNGYFDFLIQHLDKMVKEGFLEQSHRLSIQSVSSEKELLSLLTTANGSR